MNIFVRKCSDTYSTIILFMLQAPIMLLKYYAQKTVYRYVWIVEYKPYYNTLIRIALEHVGFFRS